MSPTISQLGAIPLQSFSTCQKLSPQLSRGVFARFWQVSDIVRRNFNVREGGFCVTKWIRKGAKPGRIECKRRSLSKKRWSRGTIAEGTSFICQMLFKPPENVSRWGQNESANARLDNLCEGVRDPSKKKTRWRMFRGADEMKPPKRSVDRNVCGEFRPVSRDIKYSSCGQTLQRHWQRNEIKSSSNNKRWCW